jgi:arylsulfatase A-like enzyme
MKRINSVLAIVVTTLLFPDASVAAKSEALQQGRQPNVVFIMADDLGYGDLGCYGQKEIRTPNMDRLASQGLRFTQAYSGGPVCTPARSVLMTGLHNGHTPARDNIPHYHTYLKEEDVTVAEVLKAVGYRTGGVGKWSLGDAGTVGRATNQGFDSWFGYLNQDHAHYYYTEYLDDDEGRLELAGNTKSREHYSHDLLTERALKFIEENKDQPFFLYAAFTVPHFASRQEDPDRFTVPSTAPYDDKDWDAKGKKLATMIHMLDRDVGRIVALIDELGLTDNTLIVLTSDHGGHETSPEYFNTSGPLTGFKRSLTEGGIRVPFIVRWPGRVPEGESSDEIVTFWDMMPTLAELAGADTPSGLDGISVVPALFGGKNAHSHEYLYWDYGHCRDRYDQAIRMGNWKGIRLGSGSALQLYNLETDIGEKNDVANKHPKVVERIESLMAEAVTPHPNYPVGTPYTGKPIWQKQQ